MNRQDLQGVRSPTDIERKYDLRAISGLKKAVRLNEEVVNKTDAILQEFIDATLVSLEDINGQLDGSVMTHFYGGTPTLENVPASEWSAEERENHLGDWYYDRDTGKAFRFSKVDGLYCWRESKSSSVIEAMALANAAYDTADGKRRVFTNKPTDKPADKPKPPYDNGDLWFRDGEIYVCQISKSEGETYLEGDFIKATKYTDNTLAKKNENELEILRGTVTTIREDVNSYNIDFVTTVKSVQDKIEKLEEVTKTSYSFGTEELTIEKSNSEMKTHISEKGMKVSKNGEVVLSANNNGVDAVNLHAKTYLIIGKNSRFEDMGTSRTGCFWIGE